MHCQLRVGLLTGMLIAPSWAMCQEPALRLGEVRRVTRQPDGRVEQRKGDLLADARRRELRLESQDASDFAIPFESLRALHVEKDRKNYLTVFYDDPAGRTRFETLRLEGRALSTTADVLERQTGLVVDRTGERHSFLGIPIRAAMGEQVSIVDRSGVSVRGTLAELSLESVTLISEAGYASVVDAASVDRIRLARSKSRSARKGFSSGFAMGAALCGVSAALLSHASGGGVDAAVLEAAAICGAIHGGIGAALGAAFPSRGYRQRRDVYVAPQETR